MKSLNFPRVFFFFFSLILIGCSGGGDEPSENNNNNNNQVTSITISSDVSNVLVGEAITFSVVTNTNENVTSSTIISVNGNSLSGNTFTPSIAGSFTVIATYNSLTSNSITVSAQAELTSLSLSTNNNPVYQGDSIVFSVTGNTGEVLTTQATITHNGVDVGGNSYATSNTGLHEFVATYDGITSNTLQVNVLEPPTTFNQRVLIEDYTGTWCGYCPRVAYGIELVKAQTTDAVSVAIHRGNTNPSSGTYDPFNYSAGVLENLIGLSGYPTAMLNRTIEWIYPEPNNVSQVVNLTNGNANLGLAITTELYGSTIDIDVNVKFGGLFNESNVKLVVYILEDGLIYNQTNYTSYYGGTSVISNFEHNDVLRTSLTDLLGETIPNSEIVTDGVYTRTFSLAVPANVTNSSNMRVVAFVTNNSNKTINVRAADFGVNQTFEEL